MTNFKYPSPQTIRIGDSLVAVSPHSYRVTQDRSYYSGGDYKPHLNFYLAEWVAPVEKQTMCELLSEPELQEMLSRTH